MNKELKTIYGDSITVGSANIPVAHLKYKGNSKTYITWTLLDETPGLNGNDKCLYSICPVDIDVYSDGNYLDIVKKIKELMENNEWIWTGDSTEMIYEDTGLYHKTCTFEKERNLWQELDLD